MGCKKQGAKKQDHCYSKREEARLLLLVLNKFLCNHLCGWNQKSFHTNNFIFSNIKAITLSLLFLGPYFCPIKLSFIIDLTLRDFFPSKKLLGFFFILLCPIQLSMDKMEQKAFSNFSCMFLNPNFFFQFEF